MRTRHRNGFRRLLDRRQRLSEEEGPEYRPIPTGTPLEVDSRLRRTEGRRRRNSNPDHSENLFERRVSKFTPDSREEIQDGEGNYDSPSEELAESLADEWFDEDEHEVIEEDYLFESADEVETEDIAEWIESFDEIPDWMEDLDLDLLDEDRLYDLAIQVTEREEDEILLEGPPPRKVTKIRSGKRVKVWICPPGTKKIKKKGATSKDKPRCKKMTGSESRKIGRKNKKAARKKRGKQNRTNRKAKRTKKRLRH